MRAKSHLKISIIFFLLAALLYIWMWVIRQNFPVLYTPKNNPDIYMGVEPETNPFLEPWQRWDTLHYQAIAKWGYGAFETALFTPPLYPWLIRFTSNFFGGNTLAAGMFISAIFAWLTLLVFYQISCEIFQNENKAMRATLYFLSFPSAFFLFATYTESLYLFFTLMALRFATNNKFWQAGVMGGMASLTRSPGILIIIPLGFAAWNAYKTGKTHYGWTAIAITLALSFIYPLTAWLTIQATPVDILQAVGRGGHITLPGLNLLTALQNIAGDRLFFQNLMETIFTILFIFLSIETFREFKGIFGIYALVIMLFLLSRMGNPQPLVGMIRYVYTIFPAFFLLAKLGENPTVHRVILYFSWLFLLFMSAQFAIWGWVG